MSRLWVKSSICQRPRNASICGKEDILLYFTAIFCSVAFKKALELHPLCLPCMTNGHGWFQIMEKEEHFERQKSKATANHIVADWLTSIIKNWRRWPGLQLTKTTTDCSTCVREWHPNLVCGLQQTCYVTFEESFTSGCVSDVIIRLPQCTQNSLYATYTLICVYMKHIYKCVNAYSYVNVRMYVYWK